MQPQIGVFVCDCKGLVSDHVDVDRVVHAAESLEHVRVVQRADVLCSKQGIAGMEENDFSISLDAKRLIISGIRRDPAAKLGYQQMEILYGHFETDVHLPRAIDADQIEATYQNGFLHIRLPKARPLQVPVVSTEDSSS